MLKTSLKITNKTSQTNQACFYKKTLLKIEAQWELYKHKESVFQE